MIKPNSHIINIAIIDDQNVVRSGLCSLISALGNFNVIAETNNGKELLMKLSRSKKTPDICILDVNMYTGNGWDLLAEIRSKWPSIKVLVLTLLNAKDIVNNIRSFGVNGYLPKRCFGIELKEALLKIYSYGYYFPEETSQLIYANSDEVVGKRPNKKETMFLTYCCKDLTYKEIAKKMNISVRTIDGYRDALFDKLKVHTRQGLVMHAIRTGLISPYAQ